MMQFRFAAHLRKFGARIRRGRHPGAEAHRSELTRLATEASSCLLDLDGAIPELEEVFLRMGDRAMQAEGAGRALNQECDGLLQLAVATGADNGDLRQAMDLLRGPLEFIDECVREIGTLFELLTVCERRTQDLLGIQHRMHDIIAPLGVIAVLFKIESAYLPEEIRDTFSTVTLEVERLHRLVDDTFAKDSLQMSRANETLGAVRTRLQSEFSFRVDEIRQKRGRVEEAVRRLDEHLAASAQLDERLRASNLALSGEMSRIVTGLQFQDIVKQKCDHVCEALRESDRQAQAGAVLRLQAGQLQAAIDDLRSGCGSIGNAVDRIREVMQQSHATGSSGDGFESMTASIDAMVALVAETLGELNDLIRGVAGLMEEGFQAVQPANGITHNLLSTIGELSLNMRLIALNAQVRSVQTGQGTGLETLAARTAEISSEIEGIGGEITVDLGHLHREIDEMMSLFDEIRSRGRVQLEQIDQRRSDIEGRLGDLRDKADSAVEAIGARVREVGVALQEVSDSLAGMAAWSDRVEVIARRLAVGAGASVGDGHGAELMHEQARRYTMESERVVHLRVVGGDVKRRESDLQADPGLPPGPVAVEAAQAGSGDFGDNVELF